MFIKTIQLNNYYDAHTNIHTYILNITLYNINKYTYIQRKC